MVLGLGKPGFRSSGLGVRNHEFKSSRGMGVRKSEFKSSGETGVRKSAFVSSGGLASGSW